MLSIPRIRLVILAVLAALAALAVAVPAAASADFSLTIAEEGGTGTYECEVDGEAAEACESGDEFPEDSEVVVIPEPDEGFEFVGFTGDCGFLVCELEMDSDKEVTAIFEGELGLSYELNLEVEGGGFGEIECDAGAGFEECDFEYEAGTELTLLAVSEEGSEFEEWGGDCASFGEDEECDLTMDEERSVSALFEEVTQEFELEIAFGGNGDGEVECEAEEGPEPCESGDMFEAGTELTLIPVAKPGSSFVEWEGDCEGQPEECDLTMDEDHFVEPIFSSGTPNEFELEVEVTGEGSVSANEPPVPVDGGIDGCEEGGGAECEALYTENDEVTLVATPKTGWETSGWTGCTELNPNECKVKMTADKTVEVEFAETTPNEFELEVEVTGEGSVSANEPPVPVDGGIDGCEEGGGAECEALYTENDEVTLVATPKTGWETSGWTGCTELNPNECKVKMTADKTVEVEFAETTPNEFELEVEVTGEGSVSANEPPVPVDGGIDGCEEGGGAECEALYTENDEVTLVATPKTGWETSGWTGCTELNPNECKVKMTADKTVEVEFAETTPNEFELEVEVTGEGSVSANEPPVPVDGGIDGCEEGGGAECEALYTENDEVTLVATPKTGWETSGWTGCTELNPNECKVKMTADKTVEVEFEEEGPPPPLEFTLSVTKNGTGTGTVSCNGGACAAKYLKGTTVTLAASPASGSTFAGWSGGGCSGTGSCVVTINADTSVTATFNVTGTGTGTGGGGGGNGGGGGGTPQEGTAKVAGSASVSGGKAALKITCSGGPCKGTLKLVAKVKQGKKTKSLTIGKASFNIASGAQVTLKVKLSGPAKQELAKGKTVKAKVQGTGVAQTTVKLKNAKKKKKK